MSTASLTMNDKRSRRKRDWIMFTIRSFGALNFFVALCALGLFFFALPFSFAEMDANLGLRTTWDQGLLRYLFIVMMAGFILGSVGLMLNSKRLKRAHDFIRVNFVLAYVVSTIGILTYLIQL